MADWGTGGRIEPLLTGGSGYTAVVAPSLDYGADAFVLEPPFFIGGTNYAIGPDGSVDYGIDRVFIDLPFAYSTGGEPFNYPQEFFADSGLFAEASLTANFSLAQSVSADLTSFGALRWEVPPRAALTAEGVLEVSDPVSGRSGGSVARVDVQPEGKGTKVLAGSTSRVLVNALGEGVRITPFNAHPNEAEDPGYLPSALAALATNRLNTIEPDDVVPRPTLTRQSWSSDAPISRPAPAPSEPLVDLGGFAFGASGIMIPVVEEDVEAMVVPTHEGMA